MVCFLRDPDRYREEKKMPARRRQVSRTVFNDNFSVLDTIFCRKSLELTKNYHQKLITPNGLIKGEFYPHNFIIFVICLKNCK
jgi:hypothetical protein